MAFVYERTHSGTWVALTTAARVLPIVVFGPLGGVMSDRHDRRALMITSDLIRAGLMVALVAVATAGLPLFLAPVLAAAATMAATVQPPSVAASTARLVPESERLTFIFSALAIGAIPAGAEPQDRRRE